MAVRGNLFLVCIVWDAGFAEDITKVLAAPSNSCLPASVQLESAISQCLKYKPFALADGAAQIVVQGLSKMLLGILKSKCID